MESWISVKEGLPEIGDECLILMEVGSNIEKGEYKGDGDWLGNWFSMRGENHNYKVTHWMPLPEIPEVQHE